jgi:acyl carrier protein
LERNVDALEPVKIRSLDEIKEELKKLFVENLSLEDLKPEDIKDDMELFGETGIGLDSLDGVEIVVLLRRQYGLDVKAMQKGRDIFRSINTLAPYVLANATK